MEPTAIPWTQFREELRIMYSPPSRARATWHKVRQALDLAAAAGATTTADLTPVLIARIVQGRPEGESSYTIQSLLRSLRAACSYALNCGYVRVNPFNARAVRSWVRLASPKMRRHVTREEIHRILILMAKDVEDRRGWGRWKARRLQAMTSVVVYCGLRSGEATHLWVEDVELESHIIWIRDRGKRLKTVAAGAPVPIPEALVPILTDWLNHRSDRPPIGFGSASYTFTNNLVDHFLLFILGKKRGIPSQDAERIEFVKALIRNGHVLHVWLGELFQHFGHLLHPGRVVNQHHWCTPGDSFALALQAT